MNAVMDYLMLAPAQAQGRLLAILQAVEEALPQAELRIHHSVPAFQAAGRDLLRVAAYKDHFGLYPDREILRELKGRYPGCRYTKASVQIPYHRPFPYDLLEEMVERIREIEGSSPCEAGARRPATAPPSP